MRGQKVNTTDVVFEGTGFNVKYWSRHTLAGFVAECVVDGIMAQYQGGARVEVLTIIYQLIQTAAGYDVTRTEAADGAV